MNKPRIIEIAGSCSTGKSTLVEGLQLLTEHKPDIRIIKDTARTYLETLGRPVDALTPTDRCEMQRTLFAELVEEICKAEVDKKLLIVDSGLVTNLAYSEGITGEEFFMNQLNITRSFVRNMAYSVLYTPNYYGLIQDGLRQCRQEDQERIDKDIWNMIERVNAPVYTMGNGNREARALEAYDQLSTHLRQGAWI